MTEDSTSSFIYCTPKSYQQDIFQKTVLLFFWSCVNFMDGQQSKIKPLLQRLGIMCYSSSPFSTTASSFIHSLGALPQF